MRRANLSLVMTTALSAATPIASSLRAQRDGVESLRHKRTWKYEKIEPGKKPKQYTEELAAEYKAEVDDLLQNPLDKNGVPRHFPNNGFWDVKKYGMRRRVFIRRDVAGESQKMEAAMDRLGYIKTGLTE